MADERRGGPNWVCFVTRRCLALRCDRVQSIKGSILFVSRRSRLHPGAGCALPMFPIGEHCMMLLYPYIVVGFLERFGASL